MENTKYRLIEKTSDHYAEFGKMVEIGSGNIK